MLKQTQKLSQKISPQIIQRQNLLAIPTMSLEQIIKGELESNPFLEEPTSQDVEELEEVDSTTDQIKAEEYDWDDFYKSEYEGFKTAEVNAGSDFNYENLWKEKVTIHDNLMNQLYQSLLSDKEIFIGEEIIGNIDEDGYLRESNHDVLDELNVRKFGTGFENETFTEEDVENVLKQIQKFEPAGICARSLKECLLLQLEESTVDSSLKKLCDKIVTDYFEELRLRNYEKIMNVLNISRDKVKNAFECILKLNPKPGFNEDEQGVNYIYPDLIVTKKENEYLVMLNERNLPRLKINKQYRELVSHENSSVNKDAKDFLSDNLERARWFIEALKSRRQTMLKVMKAILRRQFAFFENLGDGLKPMIEKDIADEIGIDISTVSRTIRGKYVQTDFGIYELKYFFSNALANREGEDISTKEIKNTLREIIENEDKKDPHTDDKLVEILTGIGYNIARRTVAKYRESLKIPKARLRRRIN